VIPKTEEHTVVTDKGVAATCKSTGLTEGSHCSVCDKVLVAQTVIPKNDNHSVVTDKAVAATCKNTGRTEGSHCSRCGKVYDIPCEFEPIRPAFETVAGHMISEIHYYYKGVCSDCLKREQESKN
jgi:methionyl-tRNA synthetase